MSVILISGTSYFCKAEIAPLPYLSSVGEENLAPPPTNSIDTPFFVGAT